MYKNIIFDSLIYGLMQLINYAIPILLIPFFIKRVGIDVYGDVVFLQSITVFATIFTEFGLSWSGTKFVAVNKTNKLRIGKYLTAAIAVQLMVVVVFVFIFLIWSLYVKLSVMAYLVSLMILIGQVFSSIWFMQGVHELKRAALFQFLGKILALPIPFIMVENSNDEIWVLLYFGLSALITGVITFIWIKGKYINKSSSCKGKMIFYVFRSSLKYLFSRCLIGLYAILTPILLAFIVDSKALVIYNAADKIKNLLQALSNPLVQVLYPRISRAYLHDKSEWRKLLQLSFFVLPTASGLISLIVYCNAEYLMNLMLHENNLIATRVMKIMAFIPFVIVFSNILGVQVMLPAGRIGYFNFIFLIVSLLGVVLILPVASKFGIIGVSIFSLMIESLITVWMAIFVLRNLNIFR